MTSNISFQERAKLSATILSKQPAVTLKEAKEQVQWLKPTAVQRRRNKEINSICKR